MEPMHGEHLYVVKMEIESDDGDEYTVKVGVSHWHLPDGSLLVQVDLLGADVQDFDVPVEGDFKFPCDTFTLDTVIPAGVSSMLIPQEINVVDRKVRAVFNDIVADLEGSAFEIECQSIIDASERAERES